MSAEDRMWFEKAMAEARAEGRREGLEEAAKTIEAARFCQINAVRGELAKTDWFLEAAASIRALKDNQ